MDSQLAAFWGILPCSKISPADFGFGFTPVSEAAGQVFRFPVTSEQSNRSDQRVCSPGALGQRVCLQMS